MLNLSRQQLGNYRLIQQLGSGGLADVYLGEHLHLKTFAAIKVLRTPLSTQDGEQFLQEARTIAQLKHPHIVRVLDCGFDGATVFP
jgi:serine/threonine protein kinase